MKIHIDFPWGSLDFEREPMDKEKFYAACVVVGIALVVSLFIAIAIR